MPTRLVLRIGPTGLPSVWVAISAAARNPIAAPTPVGHVRSAGIQWRHRATTPVSDVATSPPTTPPTNSPVFPAAFPRIDPSTPPPPPRRHDTTNRKNRG